MDAIGPQLKVIAQYAVGFDNIDVAAATARHIPVGNTPGVLTETTADMAWALLMASARRVAECDRYTRAGKWQTWGPNILLGQDVHGATLGIVGFGRIGQAMARRAQGFAMRVLYYDVQRIPAVEAELKAEYVPLETLLAESDFVSIHTNLSPETRHLFGPAQFARMKPTASLINTARGPIVDEAALCQALAQGQIASAGLDVTEVEPLAMDSPLLKLENVILAPHIASGSVKSRTKMATMAAENIVAGLQGQKLPTCVNPGVYQK
jgi:glyoxylate reductase